MDWEEPKRSCFWRRSGRESAEFGVGTIVGVAKKLGVHRRMVREAIASALPSPRKSDDNGRGRKLKAAVEFVDAIPEG